MTVEDLIEELEKYPAEFEVVIDCDDRMGLFSEIIGFDIFDDLGLVVIKEA